MTGIEERKKPISYQFNSCGPGKTATMNPRSPWFWTFSVETVMEVPWMNPPATLTYWQLVLQRRNIKARSACFAVTRKSSHND